MAGVFIEKINVRVRFSKLQNLTNSFLKQHLLLFHLNIEDLINFQVDSAITKFLLSDQFSYTTKNTSQFYMFRTLS